MAENFTDNHNFNIASISKRMVAFTIDELLLSVLFLITYSDYLSQATSQEMVMQLISKLVWQLIFIKVLYHTFFIWMYGATIGKLICKIRCVNENAEKPDFKAALMRALVRIVSESLLYVGFFWAYFNPLKQTWHDIVAKTLVVDVG